MGEVRTLQAIQSEQTCDPIYTNLNVAPNLTSINGQLLNASAVAIPCGLIAKSIFTDTFLISSQPWTGTNTTSAGSNITIDDSNIAWKSDVEYKFKNQPGDY